MDSLRQPAWSNAVMAMLLPGDQVGAGTRLFRRYASTEQIAYRCQVSAGECTAPFATIQLPSDNSSGDDVCI
jgi:hypothetical protein